MLAKMQRNLQDFQLFPSKVQKQVVSLLIVKEYTLLTDSNATGQNNNTETQAENKMDVGFKFHRLTTSHVVGFLSVVVGCQMRRWRPGTIISVMESFIFPGGFFYLLYPVVQFNLSNTYTNSSLHGPRSLLEPAFLSFFNHL